MQRIKMMTIVLTGAALMVGGCSGTSSKPAAQKPAEPTKSAATTTSAKPATGAVSSTVDPSFADLEKVARAAAEGKPAPTTATTAAAVKPAATLPATPHDKPGFATKVVDGRLWVFKAGAKEIAEFVSHGELAKSVTQIGVGPEGMTIRAPDAATIDAYVALQPAPAAPAAAPAKPAATLPATPHDKPGFATKVVDGRLWVFKAGAKEIAEFISHGELAKSVTQIGVGPEGMSVRAPDAETITTYLAVK